MRICIVGGGLAGTLLAWRLRHSDRTLRIDLVTGSASGGDLSTFRPPDATAASGGGVRAYESHPLTRALATQSLAELLHSPTLRNWADYRRIGSTYLRTAWPQAQQEVRAINRVVSGSAELYVAADLMRAGWRNVDAGTVAIVETEAGHINPQAFRLALLADLARDEAVHIEAQPATAVLTPAGRAPGGPARCRVGRTLRDYDVVVIAAGAWTPGLLAGADGPTGSGSVPPSPYRTKAIQYALHPASGCRPTFFVDDTTGLYGRPVGEDMMLLGIPVPRYGGPPDGGDPSPELDNIAVGLAAQRLPELHIGPRAALVRAADCYTDPPTLALRSVTGQRGIFTFTGGSGGSAKTALAASQLAARQLIAGAGAGP